METILSSIVILTSVFAFVFLFVIVQDLWQQRGKANAGIRLASDKNPNLSHYVSPMSNVVRGYDSPELYHGDTLLARAGIPREDREMPIPGRQPNAPLYELLLSGTIPAEALAQLLIDKGLTEVEFMKKLDEQRHRRRDMLNNKTETGAKPGRKND